MTLHVVPCFLAEAHAFVEQHHRQHRPSVGGHFASACADDDGVIHGVAVIGRPVARMSDNGFTAEVTRLATDGTPNACSFLYSRAWRACQSLGYRKLITYILSEEPGASLKASGWRCLGKAGGGSWSVPSRPRVNKHPTQIKMKYEIGS